MRITRALLVAVGTTVLSATPATAHAQVSARQLPPTPPGTILRAWLDAYNSGDSVRLAAYYARYEPSNFEPATSLNRRETGGFDVMSVEYTGPRRVEVTLKERNTSRFYYGIVTTPADGSLKVVTFRRTLLGENAKAEVARIDAARRALVIERAVALLDQRYIFPEIAKRIGDSLRARQQRGAYDGVTNAVAFGTQLHDELREIANDKHLRIDYSVAPLPPPQTGPTPAAVLAQELALLASVNCFFVKAEVLPGNIGYLKIDGFEGADMCRATASSAMDFLANTRALIIDLRENSGGSPGMVAHVASYLYSQKTQLSSIWERPSGQTEDLWTRDDVPGRKFGGEKPLYILTAARTISAGEALAYNLKSSKRGVIVGEVTAGAANPASRRRIDDHFTIAVPAARVINPITKANWEGVGVEPDVKVPATDALAAALKLLAPKAKP